jgi:hypothetical protein
VTHLSGEPLYRTESFALPGAPGGDVCFDLRMPVNAAGRSLPVLIVLAGIKTGHQTLERLPAPGDNAVIAYAYPYDRERWRRSSIFRRALVVYRMSRDVCGQVDVLLRWVKSQSWADSQRVHIVGGSLGAILLPMILRYVQARGESVRTAVMAYGGAGRMTLAYLSLRHRSHLLGAAAGLLVGLFLRHIEPARHLPHLRGEFLVVSSPDDSLVPRRCAQRLETLLPEPKTIIHMRGEHVDASNQKLLFDVVSVVCKWMQERGVLNL